MKDMLMSDDFKAFRKKQIGAIVRFISARFEDPLEMKGAMGMARQLLDLPATLVEGEAREMIKEMIRTDWKEFESRYVRSHVLDDET